ncbi:histidine kinase [Fulvivirga sp. 29W222]|uniref:Histidine kinase n=1 Tax=Fulvivirga marina TaxID=2494733 RepID=A0A937FZI4_9BACT|nr:histidine kinase [Fulvivirga marina]MBL6447353.1 histidine kinase [Fulvivirga marina]
MKKYLICLMFIGCLIPRARGQHNIYLYNDLPLTPSVETENETQSYSPEDILEKEQLRFEAPDKIIEVPSGSTYWLRFDFSAYMNLFEKHDTIYLNTPNFFRGAYYIQQGSTVQPLEINFFEINRFKSNKVKRSYLPVTKSNLLMGRFIIIKTEEFLGGYRWKHSGFYLAEDNESVIQDYSFFRRSFERQTPIYLFLGLAGALFILNVLLYLNSNNSIYLFYSLFLLFQSAYYSQLSLNIITYFEANHPHLLYVVTSVTQIAINLMYLLFIRSFLEMPTDYPKLDKAVKLIAYFLGILVIADTIILVVNPFFSYQTMLMDFQRYFMSLFALYGIIHLLIFKKSNLVYFVVIGTATFVTGALFTMFLLKIKYMLAGASIESFVFATGLAYRIKMVYEDKLNLEKEAVAASKSALRAQINPHFIFNALNSIQHLITVNDKKSALKYLTKFSHLLRQILENSIEVNVPLKREIELLNLYLELESLRFDRGFEYAINVNERLDIHNLEMPLFLIQPYVENAIIHGLMPAAHNDKQINIEFSEQDAFILCVISDNGIGRAAAKARRKKTVYVSRGMSVTKKRLDLINMNRPQKTLVSFEDSDKGTKVIINIPKM